MCVNTDDIKSRNEQDDPKKILLNSVSPAESPVQTIADRSSSNTNKQTPVTMANVQVPDNSSNLFFNYKKEKSE